MEQPDIYEIDTISDTLKITSSYEEACAQAFADNEAFYERSQTQKFCWWAMLFGPMYFLYRKMYLETLVIVIAAYFLPSSIYVSILVWLIEGIVFYPLYQRFARRRIDALLAKNNTLNETEQLELLHRKGGTSLLLPVIIGIGYFILVFLLTLLELQ